MRQKESQKVEEFLPTYTRPYTRNRLEGMKAACIKFCDFLLNYRSTHTLRSDRPVLALLMSSRGAQEELRSSASQFDDDEKTKISLNRFRNIDLVLDKFHVFFVDFDQNRIRTHRDQFSVDFGVRRLYPRRRHYVRPLLGVENSRRPTKTV